MTRWGRITGLCLAVFCLLAPAANAAPLGKAVLAKCDPATGEAVFEGRQSALRQSKMQMKFTLQVAQGKAKWRRVAADGFDAWITVPSGFAKYTYGKTVQGLLPGSNYRTVVTLPLAQREGPHAADRARRRRRCAACPRPRPDLVLREVANDSAGYVAKVFNRGRTAAGPFDVALHRRRRPAWARRGWSGWRPGSRSTSSCPARACTEGEALEAVVDPGSEVDESNEENDVAHRLLLSLYARLHW